MSSTESIPTSRRPHADSSSGHVSSAGTLHYYPRSTPRRQLDDFISLSQQQRRRRPKKKRHVWLFRIGLVVLDIIVYLALSDTAQTASGPRPAKLPTAPVVVQAKQVFVPLHKARSLSQNQPEFTPMERFVLNENVEVLTSVQPNKIPKLWWMYVLIGGFVLEQVYAKIDRTGQIRELPDFERTL